ncbi:carbamoyltransferase family protein [Streptantibioticus silvisoli]|uniref:Carbamoyltransferase C-terminal domain-containing protein n=1 Tax=Streptantibioticus silvisoli TaxID=2705255 RepID=A0ABT6W034_9ACTN|nr:carbamoyltransferase C-terminal domain-containing protein [Streptantibioticus silvisoli]MDI5964096.1 carbamoyltransferase C-terminal domain-containing protein [Streptantibioticus silvisoli]
MRRPPSVVLGLCAFTHDSAAALLVDGRLVGFVEEERLSGVKHTKAYPALAVEWLMREAGTEPADIEVVAYNFRASGYFGAAAETPRWMLSAETRARACPRAAGFTKVGVRTLRRLRSLGHLFPRAAVHPVLHHRAHQLTAFAASGWDEAAVLVIDSLGERQTTTIGRGRLPSTGKPSVDMLQALRDPASLGYAYGAVTEHLGWRRGDEEGTVMALAALGDPARFRSLFEQAIRITSTGFTLDPTVFPLRVLSSGHPRVSSRFTDLTCRPRAAGEPAEAVHQDLAAALQERTDEVMLHLARRARDLTGSRRLCLGGGVATNCVTVGRIIDAGLLDEVFVPPAPGDAGTALGAAMAAHGDHDAVGPLAGIAGACYLGPAFPSAALDLSRWPTLREQQLSGDCAGFLADQLAEGAIVGLFQGRAEAGPRALGNRSILASPLRAGVVERLNATVKFREPFRPFAPMVSAERADDFFTLGQRAPFMSMASGVTDAARQRVPAVVHANGTARLQTVSRTQNPFVHRVLEEFGRRTGVPVLINTSLNVKGRPMCGTPDMALACLAGSGLDALLIEGRWITK